MSKLSIFPLILLTSNPAQRLKTFYRVSAVPPSPPLSRRRAFSWEKATVWPIKKNYEEVLDAAEVNVSLAFH